ncbi:MAG: tRNA-dihydrouridine synthase [gamma proteobacterium symbiont of Bathyaustriella thionipta]|nr:tRNA-dihydrouridine synthase [gamma proteobacterium symbiont of Bathyaustriella thionipta]
MPNKILKKTVKLQIVFVQTLVTSVEVPVTLKIRTGWDPQSRNATRIARIAEQAGISAITVHGRTRECRFAGSAEYDSIRAVKAAVNIPVIANGDIDSPRKAEQVLQMTGADAIMIGRATQGRPWIFHEIQHYLTCGKLLPEPDPLRVAELLHSHLRELYQLYGNEHGVLIARKHIGWYCKGNKGAASFRKKINSISDWQEQLSTLKHYFSVLGEQQDKAA